MEQFALLYESMHLRSQH